MRVRLMTAPVGGLISTVNSVFAPRGAVREVSGMVISTSSPSSSRVSGVSPSALCPIAGWCYKQILAVESHPGGRRHRRAGGGEILPIDRVVGGPLDVPERVPRPVSGCSTTFAPDGTTPGCTASQAFSPAIPRWPIRGDRMRRGGAGGASHPKRGAREDPSSRPESTQSRTPACR